MGRLIALALGAVVLLGGIYGLATLFSSRDDAGVEQSGGPGTLEPDRGAKHVTDEISVSMGDPPTSGPHQVENVTRDARRLSDAQILHALELGDVILFYPGQRPPAELVALQEEVAGAFDAELAAAGQAVILARRPELDGVQALAWRRRLRASGPDDPNLREFAEQWLGQGVDGAR